MTEGIEIPDQEKIRTFGEMETYLGILEVGTIKQVEMKEKNEKNMPGEREKYSKLNYIAEISSKRKSSGLFLL